MRWLPLLLALLPVACGGGSITSPTPQPQAFHGTVTDTVSGAPIIGFSAVLNGSRVTVSAPGYVTRESAASAGAVDLIPQAGGFDLAFYRQFARNALDLGTPDVLRVLAQPPSIYLQRTGLPDANVAALEQAARAVIPALTGNRFQLAAWETGDALRPDAVGWIIVELVNDPAQPCGRTVSIGAPAGHVRLNLTPNCQRVGGISPAAFAHEIGHCLGFGHVPNSGALMRPSLDDRLATDTSVSDLERYHAAIAYHRHVGSRDIDVDP